MSWRLRGLSRLWPVLRQGLACGGGLGLGFWPAVKMSPGALDFHADHQFATDKPLTRQDDEDIVLPVAVDWSDRPTTHQHIASLRGVMMFGMNHPRAATARVWGLDTLSKARSMILRDLASSRSDRTIVELLHGPTLSNGV